MTEETRPVLRDEPLDRAQVAALVGWTHVGTVSKQRGRGIFPKEDGKNGRSPYWYRSTVENWINTEKRGRGQTSEEFYARKAAKEAEAQSGE